MEPSTNLSLTPSPSANGSAWLVEGRGCELEWLIRLLLPWSAIVQLDARLAHSSAVLPSDSVRAQPEYSCQHLIGQFWSCEQGCVSWLDSRWQCSPQREATVGLGLHLLVLFHHPYIWRIDEHCNNLYHYSLVQQKWPCYSACVQIIYFWQEVFQAWLMSWIIFTLDSFTALQNMQKCKILSIIDTLNSLKWKNILKTHRLCVPLLVFASQQAYR